MLETPAWRDFRRGFISRKGNICEKCGRVLKIGLQVHHKCYREECKPWEYADSDLMCLCADCHHALHKELIESGVSIPVYDKNGKRSKIPDELCCRRCGGTGFREEFSFIMGGLCLSCFGTGIAGMHHYTGFEARKYGLKIYHQWLAHHEDKLQHYSYLTFDSAKDVEKWLLSLNTD